MVTLWSAEILSTLEFKMDLKAANSTKRVFGKALPL